LVVVAVLPVAVLPVSVAEEDRKFLHLKHPTHNV